MAKKHYINWGSGVLFQATKKTSDKAPDYNGRICTDGHEFYLSGWKMKAKSGLGYLRLQIGSPLPASTDDGGATNNTATTGGDGEDIPF